MKRRGIMGMLLLGLLLIGATACESGGEVTTTQPTVKKDITVTGDGNIEASSHERLTFGSGGKVEEIYVKEGDRVSKGDVLARLDTVALELAEAQAQVALTQAQLALTGQELAISQAEVNVKNAEIALEKAKDSWLDTESAGKKVKRLQKYLEWYLEDDPEDHERITAIRLDLREAWDHFLMIVSDSTDSRQVTANEMELELAKQSVEYAQQNINLAQQNVYLAQKSLDKASKNLEEAAIVAPFDGIVSKVGVKEGEFLSPAAYTGTTIIELIDSRHIELTARVDELDVVKVKIGQKVMISVDAMPGMKLEGFVTFISPVARESGIVLFEDEDKEKEYEVKIDFNIPENTPIRAGMSATAEIIVE
jgi:multidrug resistance efflux pump